MRDRLTTDKTKIFARESLTIMSMNKDELRRHYNEIFDRLQEYEVAEEQGQIFAPPCKVGDTVYYINGRYEKQGRKKVHIEFVDKGIVDNMVIGDKGVPQINVCNDENEWTMFDSEDDFGKTVFLTKEEAEQALRKEENK